MNRLNKHFNQVTLCDLVSKDHFTNVMQLPYLNKIVLNIGLGQKLISNKKEIVKTLLALELIASQRAVPTKAKKSIDKFKLKKNMMIGSKLTLRRKNMFFFLDRLTNDVLPSLERLEEFHRKYRRLSSSSLKKAAKDFSTTGKRISGRLVKKKSSWSVGFGLQDFFSFKEIPFDKFDSTYGLDISLNIKQGIHSKKNPLLKRKKNCYLNKRASETENETFKKPFYVGALSTNKPSSIGNGKISIKNRKTFSLKVDPLNGYKSSDNKVTDNVPRIVPSDYSYFLSSFQLPLHSAQKF